MAASVQTLNLPTGLYLLSVRAGSPTAIAEAGNLQLPALNVGLGPGVENGQVEFVSGPGTRGNWLFQPGNMLIAKVVASSASLLLTSVRAANGQALDISIQRLGSTNTAPEASPEPEAPAAASEDNNKASDPAKPRHVVGLHLSGRGDVSFSDVEWAGRIGAGTWVEAFSITPLEFISPQDIEYKSLTASGFETPWISGGAACGTRGMAVALVGFAVRLKGRAAGRYDCEYSGYFQSGAIIGPLRNGAPCRSTVSGDPLEGIRFRFVARAVATASPTEPIGTSLQSARVAAIVESAVSTGSHPNPSASAAAKVDEPAQIKRAIGKITAKVKDLPLKKARGNSGKRASKV